MHFIYKWQEPLVLRKIRTKDPYLKVALFNYDFEVRK